MAPQIEGNRSYNPGTAAEYVYVQTKFGRERYFRPKDEG